MNYYRFLHNCEAALRMLYQKGEKRNRKIEYQSEEIVHLIRYFTEKRFANAEKNTAVRKPSNLSGFKLSIGQPKNDLQSLKKQLGHRNEINLQSPKKKET